MGKVINVFSNTVVRLIVIPFILFACWFILTILYIYSIDQSFSVLSYNHQSNSFSNTNNFNRLLKDERLAGSFNAKDNDLGIISVRFRTYERVPFKNEDLLLFRLKDVSSDKWIYSNIYRSGLVYDVPFFPFGFPKIDDSKGKKYYFEIISLKGNQTNSIALDNRNPILVSKYQYNKSLLLHNKKKLLTFLFIKYINALQDFETIFASFIFLLPLLFYLFLLTPAGEKIRHKGDKIIHIGILSFRYKILYTKFGFYFRLGFVLLIVTIVFIDIFYFQLPNGLVYLIVILFWIFTSMVLSLRSTISFIIGLFLFILCPFFYYINYEFFAEQLGAWTWLFIAAGVAQSIIVEQKLGNE